MGLTEIFRNEASPDADLVVKGRMAHRVFAALWKQHAEDRAHGSMPVLVIKHHAEDFESGRRWFYASNFAIGRREVRALPPHRTVRTLLRILVKVNTPSRLSAVRTAIGRSMRSCSGMSCASSHHPQRPEHRGRHPELRPGIDADPTPWPPTVGRASSMGERKPDGGYREPYDLSRAEHQAVTSPPSALDYL